MRRRFAERLPSIAREAPGDHYCERRRVVALFDQHVDVEVQALRTRAGREAARMEVERAALGQHVGGTGARQRPCNPTLGEVEQCTAGRVQRVPRRHIASEWKRRTGNQQPRRGTKPKSCQTVTACGRVRRDRQRDAEEPMRFFDERRTRRITLHVPRRGDRRFGERDTGSGEAVMAQHR